MATTQLFATALMALKVCVYKFCYSKIRETWKITFPAAFPQGKVVGLHYVKILKSSRNTITVNDINCLHIIYNVNLFTFLSSASEGQGQQAIELS